MTVNGVSDHGYFLDPIVQYKMQLLKCNKMSFLNGTQSFYE